MLARCAARKSTRSVFEGCLRSFCSSARQQPWAVPFSIDHHAARSIFESWTGSSPRFSLRSLTPEFVPFFIFQGRLHGSFTGVINEGSGEDATKEYVRDLEINPRLSMDVTASMPDGARDVAIYAGFVFPWRYIQEALLKGGGAVAAVPLDAAEAPPGTQVGYFEMHPSFAYAKVLLERDALRRRAEAAAMATFRSHPSYDKDAYLEIKGMTHDITDLTYELRPRSLADRGVVLLPCFVCEYTHNNVAGYECYISGVNGNLAGLETHPDRNEDWSMAMRSLKIFFKRHGDFSCTVAEYDFWHGEMARVKAGMEPWRDEEATRVLDNPLLNLGRQESKKQTESRLAQERLDNTSANNEVSVSGLVYFTIFAVPGVLPVLIGILISLPSFF